MTSASRILRNQPSRTLQGWLEIPNRKVSQNLRFFKLRTHLDNTSKLPTSLQLISRHADTSPIAQKLNAITRESCVEVRVQQLLRPAENQRYSEGEAGRWEYEIEDIKVLNRASQNLPFIPQDVHNVDSLLRSQNRHLEMRSNILGQALRDRAQLRTQLRSALEWQGFMEVETPLLFKSTPEGAREFLVPTRRKGQFFALPQSPQQYKQILMAGGMHRYYQFAKCFRDEDSRADRQLEFTQLDLEMAFVEMEDVMCAVSKTVLSVDGGSPFRVQNGIIRRMKYHDAMTTFGSDKPDLRFGLKISNLTSSDVGEELTDSVDVLVYEIPEAQAISNSALKQLQQSLKEHSVFACRTGLNNRKVPADFEEVASQIVTGQESITLLCRRQRQVFGGSTCMGRARIIFQSFLEKHNLVEPRPDRPFELCWITDFPLFSPATENEPGQGGSLGISSTHHPFTAPNPEDVHHLDGSLEDLMKIRGLHYDLVMNGVEIGGGSIRIHDAQMQRRVFKSLGMTATRMAQFDHLLRVLESGCPPHGGFALGFDRFVAMMCGKQSIRDVIAFPKTSSGSDPLIGSPSNVSEDTLRIYHIQALNT